MPDDGTRIQLRRIATTAALDGGGQITAKRPPRPVHSRHVHATSGPGVTNWFRTAIVDAGQLPLFILLVAFVLTFLFIRFSVRMIRAEVRWWPGNVTPGGVHMHHEFFGILLMILAGFGFIALSDLRTLLVDCLLAGLFGIGAALVLDEFALILHLRDVYWEEEGRRSIDAVFVAIAIGIMFLLGLRPFELGALFTDFGSADTYTRIALVTGVVVNVVLAVITLLKGKVWTGLVGMFLPILLVVGAIRLARPRSPWARWRYGDRPAAMATATRREMRLREPLTRWKIVVQEALAGRFGVPDNREALPVVHPETRRVVRAPGAVATAIRWHRTRQSLKAAPVWRLPTLLVATAVVAGIVSVSFDDVIGGQILDTSTTATLLAVIAGAMATLTGLVFTAVTLAMQFAGGQISVRVVPMMQQESVMRWSIGMFLATFAYTALVAADLTAAPQDSAAPMFSTMIALVLALCSIFLFIALVTRIESLLDSGQVLRWISNEGQAAIRRRYPDTDLAELGPAATDAPGDDDDAGPGGDELAAATGAGELTDAKPSKRLFLRDNPAEGRILQAINVGKIQRLAIRWEVRIQLTVAVGDYVPRDTGVIDIYGDPEAVVEHRLLNCLLFGDAHLPSVSPASSLEAISDIALKALSEGINDPRRAVDALDYIEELLLELAWRVRLSSIDALAGVVGGYQVSWADYVAVGTDEIRHFAGASAQVQRRLRALYETLAEHVAADQQEPIRARIEALDAQVRRSWPDDLDRRLASVSDRQGYGSELGRRPRYRRIR